MNRTNNAQRRALDVFQAIPPLCALLFAMSFFLAPTGAARRVSKPTPQASSRTQSSPTPVEQETTALELGKVIDRELSGGQTHPYQFALAAGQYASLVVDQRGIDLAVDVLNPDGKVLADFDFEKRKQGEEKVGLVADSAAIIKLAVRSVYPMASAGRYQIQIKEIRAADEKDRSLYEAHKLGTKADHLNEAGKYDDAIEASNQAVKMAEAALGPDDPYVALLLYRLALETRTKGDFDKAEPLFQRVLDIDRKALGEEDPRTAQAIVGQGLMCLSRNDYAHAVPLFQQAIEISERTLGPEDPQVALYLMNLGNAHSRRGNFESTVAEYQRALAISEKSFGPDSTLAMRLTYNLGDAYLDMGQLDRSEALMEKSLSMAEKTYGPDHPNVAYPLQNLGIIARRKKDYDRALEYLWRSEKLREKSIGAHNPLTATLLVNIGNVYHSKGDEPKALELFQQALAIFQETASPYDQSTMMTLSNIARTYAVLKDEPHAVEYQAKVDQYIEKALSLNLSAGSEREKLAYVDWIIHHTENTISMNARQFPNDKRAADDAVTAVLQRKGRVLDAVSGSMSALRQHLKPEDQKLLDDWNAATAELAKRSLSGPGKTPLEEYTQRLHAIEKHRESLEDDISRRSQGYYETNRAVSLAAVQAAIPSDAALLEFAVYKPFDPNAAIDTDAYGEPHYVVYVLRNQEDARWKDLGPAKEIDAAIEGFRRALRDPDRQDAKQLSRIVSEKVLEPVRALTGDVKHLLISPDGELNLVPFEALLDDQGQYAVERYSISYLTTGRDLLRMQVARASESKPVVIANPLFGEPGSTLMASAGSPNLKPASAVARRRSVTTGVDLSKIYFAPLTGTAEEARAIQSVFPEAQILTGAKAAKNALKEVHAPLILHIATHGFFLEDSDAAEAKDANTANTSSSRGSPAEARIENPLLRSGLALSGANAVSAGNNDGILTALEASSIDLWGTKLVTLSACETGVGEVKNGEGVYGLRRAFFLAGTESLVMSLWSVSDRVTREMMTSYYEGLSHGLGRGQSLRQAQLAMLKRKDRQHPFYWASFIQSGEWANLEGNR